jgi:hypothetical protein
MRAVEAKSCGGSSSPRDDYAEEILALVEEQDDRALDEIVAAMREHRTALFRFLERRGITHKKRMARPVCKGDFTRRAGLHQRIRSQGLNPGQDGMRAPQA